MEIVSQFTAKPTYGCYTVRQFHQYVLTGERFANDNHEFWAKTYRMVRDVEKCIEQAETHRLLDQLIETGRA